MSVVGLVVLVGVSVLGTAWCIWADVDSRTAGGRSYWTAAWATLLTAAGVLYVAGGLGPILTLFWVFFAAGILLGLAAMVLSYLAWRESSDHAVVLLGLGLFLIVVEVTWAVVVVAKVMD